MHSCMQHGSCHAQVFNAAIAGTRSHFTSACLKEIAGSRADIVFLGEV